MRRILTGLLGLAFVVAACGDDDTDDRSAVTSIPDTTTSPTTTTEPRTVAPDVIPQDVSLITEDYVEQVLNKLFQATNEALVLTQQTGLVEDRAIALVEATTTAEHGRSTLNGLAELARTGFEGVADDPTGLRAEVTSILNASRLCIAAEIRLDSSGVADPEVGEDPQSRSFVRLDVASISQRASNLNPTAWVLAGLPATTDGSQPDLGCEDE